MPFEANLATAGANIAETIVTLSSRVGNPAFSDQLGSYARAILAPDVYGLSHVVGLGATRVYCSPSISTPLKSVLPNSLKVVVRESEDLYRPDDIRFLTLLRVLPSLKAASPPRNQILAHILADFLANVETSARKHRALIIDGNAREVLTEAHDRLAASQSMPEMALAGLLRGFVPIETPTIKTRLRRIDMIEGILTDLMKSSEFARYGEERVRLSSPKTWMTPDPLAGVLRARDKCLSKWAELSAGQVLGLVLRLSSGFAAKFAKRLPFAGDLFSLLDLSDYQQVIYVLPEAGGSYCRSGESTPHA